ncbi:MAG: DUF1707 domain-containing protein [Propioniciclava sp.]
MTPERPEVPVWARFTADPRRRPDVRASDRDRDVALGVITEAFGEGRLDEAEHGDRLQAALAARTLGELARLLGDVVVSETDRAVEWPVRPSPSTVRVARDIAVRVWLGLALLFTVIWLATWIFSVGGPAYFWPVWPMIGTGIPTLIVFLIPDHGAKADAPDAKR